MVGRFEAKSWNAIVSSEVIVYHLGDFTMGDPARWARYRAALNDRIVLVRGSQDRTIDHRGFDVEHNITSRI